MLVSGHARPGQHITNHWSNSVSPVFIKKDSSQFYTTFWDHCWLDFGFLSIAFGSNSESEARLNFSRFLLLYSGAAPDPTQPRDFKAKYGSGPRTQTTDNPITDQKSPISYHPLPARKGKYRIEMKMCSQNLFTMSAA